LGRPEENHDLKRRKGIINATQLTITMIIKEKNEKW